VNDGKTRHRPVNPRALQSRWVAVALESPEGSCEDSAAAATGFAKERLFASGPRMAGFGHV
jgi:hypothetical protein